MHLLLLILTLLGACEALVPGSIAHKHDRRATTTTSAPAVYQTGIACNCNNYYVVSTGDTCDAIVTKYKNAFTLAQFYAWNPAVGNTCKFLGLGYSVCVGVDAKVTKCTTTSAAPPITTTSKPTTSKPISTTSPKTTTTLPPYSHISSTVINAQPTVTELQPFGVPSPVQAGIYSGCETYYQAKAGDTCASITDYFFGFNEAQFISWNPAVSYDCSGLVIGNYYCIQAQAYRPSPAVFSGPGLPSPLPNCTVSDCTACNFNDTDYSTWRFPINSCYNSTVNVTTTVPSTTTSTTTTAGPTSTCVKSYTVVAGDSCAAIQAANGITFAQLLAWNPSIGSNCEFLAIGNTYCVSKSAGTTTTTSSKPTQTSSCTKSYTVVAGDSCAAIQAKYSITFAQLLAWNPSIGSNCEFLAIGNTYCVSKSAGTTTTTSSKPTQTSSCTKSYTVVAGDSCAAIQAKYSITFAQLLAWNPSIGSNCEFLAIGNTYCVAKSAGTTTTTSSKPAETSSCTKSYTVVAGDSCAAIQAKYSITFAQLLAWNPSIGSNCEFLAIGNTYCVAKAAGTTTTTSSKPTQTSSCTKSYTVVAGDSCAAIDAKYSITFAQLFAWNPSIGSNCEFLAIGNTYCVAKSS
ncbi:hypothetical protein BKA65DRAFT_564781 [Rhexocercosporidium sp. MPI-PUGE-AT-0058]|nr:hypothetical protein BKA65DRAFT_564781 [Rhexocercosporidium sp. MPI-PUGE-AT-0058]